jgi:DNA-damage-inducible protein D
MSNNFVSSPFDAIRRYDKHGNEYWSARELQSLLGYAKWQKFEDTIQRAIKACENSGNDPEPNFTRSGKVSGKGKYGNYPVADYHMTRYACYLVAMIGDSHKEEIAAAQTYFAIQTRRQELADEQESLETEEGKRIKYRGKMRFLDNELKDEVHKAGARNPRDYSDFFDSGYRGLYGGEAENDIHARKGLQPKEKVLDHMESEELGTNIFRATQTRAKLRREKPQSKEHANDTHYEVGKKVRQTIEELGGTMPENLPTPEKSIQQLERERKLEIQKFLRSREQPQLLAFEDEE